MSVTTTKVLYVDAVGGASGDMLAGALLDLGYPLEDLRAQVALLGLEGVRVGEARESQLGLAARRLLVEEDHHSHHHHPHRHLSHCLELVGRLPGPIAAAAGKVFTRLAQAEAKVHGAAVEEVHFHEVGAADALVDITAFCAGLAHFGWPRLLVSPLPLGRGFVDCAHGRLPLPAPAVVNLLAGVPVTAFTGGEGETVTPTGAALLTALADGFGPLPAMRLLASGTGCGSRPPQGGPNVVRLLLGEEDVLARHGHADVVEIVCNLDNQNAEDLPLAAERLFAAGALDVYYTPIFMKKGRPALEFTVLSHPGKVGELARLVLRETSSLGVRLRHCARHTLEREALTVASPWGPVRMKKALLGEGHRLTPEAEDVARICRETGLSAQEVRAALPAK